MKRYLLFTLIVLLVGFLCLRTYKTRPGNAAVLYHQAIVELPPAEVWNEFVLGSVRIGGKPAPGTIAIIERYERPLELLQQAKNLPVCNWGVDLKNGPHQDFKFVTEAVKLARLALERARLRFAEGDIAEGLRDWEAGMMLARRLRGEPLVLFSLAGAKAEEIGIQKIAPFLPRFSPAELARLDEIIRSLPPTIEAFRELLAELRRGSESSEEVRTEVSVADRERDSEERERDSWQEGSPRQEE